MLTHTNRGVKYILPAVWYSNEIIKQLSQLWLKLIFQKFYQEFHPLEILVVDKRNDDVYKILGYKTYSIQLIVLLLPICV